MEKKPETEKETSTEQKPIKLTREEIIQRQIEATAKREELKEAMLKGMILGRQGKWEELTMLGLSYPTLMDRLCSAFYRELPNEYKYLLPVRWYMKGGNCSEPVLQAMRKAGAYKPEKWIGKDSLAYGKKGIDVYLGSRCNASDVRKEIAWGTSYESAYVQAQKISGNVYRGYIDTSDIIAINNNSVERILQYDSVLGIEQLYPKIPLNFI